MALNDIESELNNDIIVNNIILKEIKEQEDNFRLPIVPRKDDKILREDNSAPYNVSTKEIKEQEDNFRPPIVPRKDDKISREDNSAPYNISIKEIKEQEDNFRPPIVPRKDDKISRQDNSPPYDVVKNNKIIEPVIMVQPSFNDSVLDIISSHENENLENCSLKDDQKTKCYWNCLMFFHELGHVFSKFKCNKKKQTRKETFL